mmetsp:Transcript_14764/g.14648  ORF Transcript_14764/g.14648 Transcript_14764/m.14648 type:complete len:118 (+) Transcript_14764:134-487(+)
MAFKIITSTRVGGANGGYYHRCMHKSKSTGTDMQFGLFLPSCHSESTKDKPTPVIFWLSGLTCDDTNFANKAGSRAFYRAVRIEEELDCVNRKIRVPCTVLYFHYDVCTNRLLVLFL